MRRNFVHTDIGSPIAKQQSNTPAKIEGEIFMMPVDIGESSANIGNKAFDKAVAKGGGHFATIKPTADTYMPVYYSHGKSYAGNVHHDKKNKSKHHRVGAQEGSNSSSSDGE